MFRPKVLRPIVVFLLFISIHYSQERNENRFTVKSIFNITVAEITSTNEHMNLSSKGATAIFKSPPSFEKLKYSENNFLKWLLETKSFEVEEKIVDGEWKNDKELFDNQKISYRFLMAPDSENNDSKQTFLFRLDIKKKGESSETEESLSMNSLMLDSSTIKVFINKSDNTLNKISLDYGVMPIKILPNEK